METLFRSINVGDFNTNLNSIDLFADMKNCIFSMQENIDRLIVLDLLNNCYSSEGIVETIGDINSKLGGVIRGTLGDPVTGDVNPKTITIRMAGLLKRIIVWFFRTLQKLFTFSIGTLPRKLNACKRQMVFKHKFKYILDETISHGVSAKLIGTITHICLDHIQVMRNDTISGKSGSNLAEFKAQYMSEFNSKCQNYAKVDASGKLQAKLEYDDSATIKELGWLKYKDLENAYTLLETSRTKLKERIDAFRKISIEMRTIVRAIDKQNEIPDKLLGGKSFAVIKAACDLGILVNDAHRVDSVIHRFFLTLKQMRRIANNYVVDDGSKFDIDGNDENKETKLLEENAKSREKNIAETENK